MNLLFPVSRQRPTLYGSQGMRMVAAAVFISALIALDGSNGRHSNSNANSNANSVLVTAFTPAISSINVPRFSIPTVSAPRTDSAWVSTSAWTSTSASSSSSASASASALAMLPEPFENNQPKNVSNFWEEVVNLWEEVPFSIKAPVGIFAGILILVKCIFIVDVGQIGIASTLGSIERYDPGPHLRNPLLTRVECLSTKTRLLEQSNFVPTKEGLTVELDTAVLVRLDLERALDLYGSVGPDFVTKLVTPEASSSIRGLTSESEAKALYTSGRSDIQNRVKTELSERLGPRGIVVEDVLLKNVVLPKGLSDSIQEKARAEQDSARMEFVLQKARQEAERKAIEAEGIAEFQKIVTKGITPSLLQWKGIEATEKLAESPNAKIVIVGNTKNSLPVILGGGSGGGGGVGN